MDERHWWIAYKVQETFQINGTQNPTVLEGFMCDSENLDIVNSFLGPQGESTLFVFTTSNAGESPVLEDLHLTTVVQHAVSLKPARLMYFLRGNVSQPVSTREAERHIVSGEVQLNVLEQFSSIVSDVCLPLLRAQKGWGYSTKDSQQNLLVNLEKLSASIRDASEGSSKQAAYFILPQPSIELTDSLKQLVAGSSTVPSAVLHECELLVNDWVGNIENLLAEAFDEKLHDASSSPLDELQRWQKRQQMLTSITDQLKNRECKQVISTLIMAKSRLMKRWKVVDIAITEAVNETKDKLKFLESLRRYFEMLSSNPTPKQIASQIIPALMNTLKQVDSVSRHFARSGFLGYLFTKITNQTVVCCKSYLTELLNEVLGTNQSSEESYELWSLLIANAVQNAQTPNSEQSITYRLRSCITMQHVYHDEYRQMCGAIFAGGSRQDSQTPSNASEMESRRESGGFALLAAAGATGSHSSHRMSMSSNVTRKIILFTPVPIAEEDHIFRHFDVLCLRAKRVLDVLNASVQLDALTNSLGPVPRPRREILIRNDEDDDRAKSGRNVNHDGSAKQSSEDAVSTNQSDPEMAGDIDLLTEKTAAHSLAVIAEVNEDSSSRPMTSREDGGRQSVSSKSAAGEDDVGLRILLQHYAPGDDQVQLGTVENQDGPQLVEILRKMYEEMVELFNRDVRSVRQLLDVESTDTNMFNSSFMRFHQSLLKIERVIDAYLGVIMQQTSKTIDALAICDRFAPVASFGLVKRTLAEKYTKLFLDYETELEAVREVYESEKDSPPSIRNASPIISVLSWLNKLFEAIEPSMEHFKDQRVIMQLQNYSRTVKLYNRIQTALVTYQTVWLQKWLTGFDQLKPSLNATLLVQDTADGELVVNADPKLFEFFQEVRFLKRSANTSKYLSNEILQLAERETQLILYRDQLAEGIVEFQRIRDACLEFLKPLFKPHFDKTLLTFRPAMTSLSWASTNLDVFFYQLNSELHSLRELLESVLEAVEKRIDEPLNKIGNGLCYDQRLLFEQRQYEVERFHESIDRLLEKQANEMQQLVTGVQNTIAEIAQKVCAKNTKVAFATPAGSQNGSMQNTPKLRKVRNQQQKPLEVTRNDTNHFQLAVSHLESHYHDKLTGQLGHCIANTLMHFNELLRVDELYTSAADPFNFREKTQFLATQKATNEAQVNDDDVNSKKKRPLAGVSAVERLNWSTDTDNDANSDRTISLLVSCKFFLPNIVFDPELSVAQQAIESIAEAIMNYPSRFTWFGKRNLSVSTASSAALQSEPVRQVLNHIGAALEVYRPRLERYVHALKLYNFLWHEDVLSSFSAFVAAQPAQYALLREVERLKRLEYEIARIPVLIPVGAFCLNIELIKRALHGYAINWKSKFASVLLEEAGRQLHAAIDYRFSIQERLHLPTESDLTQLNQCLRLLDELRDAENKIDSVYLPIEQLYGKLKEFDLTLNKQDLEEVNSLRRNWQQLIELADQLRAQLLKEKRAVYEQELDKQIKYFVVEVIQFRNSFDAQGPGVAGIDPYEASRRLIDFQALYDAHDYKHSLIESIAKWFGIPVRAFPDLEKTGEELKLLTLLYGLYQKVLSFDKEFRDSLWADVNLHTIGTKVSQFWDELLAFPNRIKEWDAFHKLKGIINRFMLLIPLLKMLHGPEIRNRHWLQVMSILGSSFPLEASVFTLSYLLDIPLLEHSTKIEEICRAARHEMELETQLRAVVEEWTEQMLAFKMYPKRSLNILDLEFSHHQLELLDNAMIRLSVMLQSKYITALKQEASLWIDKLKAISVTLSIWVELQEVWRVVDEVFDAHQASLRKELPDDYKRYERTSNSFIKMMKRAFNIKNVLQCCYGADVAKPSFLRSLLEDLEACMKALHNFLDKKRHYFPRLYFLSDSSLLSMLAERHRIDHLRPYFQYLFSAVTMLDCSTGVSFERVDTNVSVVSSSEPTEQLLIDEPSSRPVQKSPKKKVTIAGHVDEKLSAPADRAPLQPAREATIITLASSHIGAADEIGPLTASAVCSDDGERLVLLNGVSLNCDTEVWLERLLVTIGVTLRQFEESMLEDIAAGSAFEELAFKYPAQLCGIGLSIYWTRECEKGLVEAKSDRKALNVVLKKFQTSLSRITNVISRGSWRSFNNAPVSYVQRVRLEAMFIHSGFLRDALEQLVSHRVREETSFEWRRHMRTYAAEQSGKKRVRLEIADQALAYGDEFYGAQSAIVYTPVTDRCFVSVTTTISQYKGNILIGSAACGKTETVKGLGHLLAKYVSFLQCTSNIDAKFLSQTLVGFAKTGCWGLIKDAHIAGSAMLSFMFDHIVTIYNAIRAGLPSCVAPNGHDLSVAESFCINLTVDPAHIQLTSSFAALPPEFRAYLRPVTMLAPDTLHILRAKCMQYGFKVAHVLGTRLHIVSDAIRAQLLPQYQSAVNVMSMMGILQYAHARKRALNPNESAEGNWSKDKETAGPNTDEVAPTQRTARVASGSSTPTRFLDTSKPSKKNMMNPAARLEHALVGAVVSEVLLSRLPVEYHPVVKTVVRDAFSGLPEAPIANPQTAGLRRSTHAQDKLTASINDFTSTLKELVAGRSVHVTDRWVDKCVQLYTMSQSSNTLLLVGPPCSGKSTILKTVVDTINRQSGEHKGSIQSNHLIHIYPHAFPDPTSIITYRYGDAAWTDGVLVSTVKRSLHYGANMWITMDGPPLQSELLDSIVSAMNSREKTWQLSSGERLHLTSVIKLVFEMTSLENLSPGTVAKTSVVFFDRDSVRWPLITHSWLRTRTNSLEAKVLVPAFEKMLDSVIAYFGNLDESKLRFPISEIGLLHNCLLLLGSMLSENKQLAGPLHIERLFIFCIVWTFGNMLEIQSDRKQFGQLLKTLSNCMPDDDKECSIFDYYVDEAGEWDRWQSRVDEYLNAVQTDSYGRPLIETTDTVRVKMLLQHAYSAHCNVLLCGPHGSGKSAVLTNFLDKVEANECVKPSCVQSASSTVSHLHKFIRNSIVHRQGFTYGAKDNRRLLLLIEDLNLSKSAIVLTDPNSTSPYSDSVNAVRVTHTHELLRQVLDKSLLIQQSGSQYEWHTVENAAVFATLVAEPLSPSLRQASINARLLRHFLVLTLPQPTGNQLTQIANGLFQVASQQINVLPIEQSLQDELATTTASIFESVKQALRFSNLVGRSHYLFSLTDLVRLVRSMSRLPMPVEQSETEGENSAGDSDTEVLTYWYHELYRTFYDRLVRFVDRYWFEQTCAAHVREHCQSFREAAELSIPPDEALFSTFEVKEATDVSVQSAASNRLQAPIMSVRAKRLKSAADAAAILQPLLTDYQQQSINMDDVELREFVLSDFSADYIVRVHRALTQAAPHHHLLIIASQGVATRMWIRLALLMTESEFVPIDPDFVKLPMFEQLRAIVRAAVVGNKRMAVAITDEQIDRNPDCLDVLNSLIAQAYYPHLFASDELDDIIQTLMPTIKKEAPFSVADPLSFVRYRIANNLQIALCYDCNHPSLRTLAHQYASFLVHANVIWVRDWTDQALHAEARALFSKSPHDSVKQLAVGDDHRARTQRDVLLRCFTDVHRFALNECNAVAWVGDTAAEVSLFDPKLAAERDKKRDEDKEKEKKKETKASLLTRLPNYPYAKKLLLEQLINNGKSQERQAHHLFVGPSTFSSALRMFARLLATKSHEQRVFCDRAQRALKTLRQCRADGVIMKEILSDLSAKHETAKHNSKHLLASLMRHVAQLERIKVKMGLSTSALNVYLQMKDGGNAGASGNGSESQAMEKNRSEIGTEDPLLLYEFDDYDREFDRIRENTLKQRQSQAIDTLAKTKKDLEDAKREQSYSRAQVDMWRSKVDKGCIDRIKAFSSPPVLVAQIVDMVLTLIGKPLNGVAGSRHNDRDESPGRGKSPSITGLRRGQRINWEGMNSERVDRALWKMMQQAISDSTRFVDMLHNLDWEAGLDTETLKLVESYLARSKDGQLGVVGETGMDSENAPSKSRRSQSASTALSDSSSPGRGITIAAAKYSSEDSATLVQYAIALIEYTHRCLPVRELAKQVTKLEVEIEEAEREKQREADRQQRAEEERRAQQEAEANEKAAEEEESADLQAIDENQSSDESLARLQREIDTLLQQYDSAVIEQYNLQREIESIRQRYETCLEMVTKLSALENNWIEALPDFLKPKEQMAAQPSAETAELTGQEQQSDADAEPNAETSGGNLNASVDAETDGQQLSDSEVEDLQLALNCFLVASFLTYCTALDNSERRRFVTQMLAVVDSGLQQLRNRSGLPVSNCMKLIFRDVKLRDMLFTTLKFQQLESFNMAPLSDLQFENHALTLAEQFTAKWPLYYDPGRRVLDWLERWLVGTKQRYVVVSYYDLKSQLESAMVDGTVLIVTECNRFDLLDRNVRLNALLGMKPMFLNKTSKFKIKLPTYTSETAQSSGGSSLKDLECDPRFRLYMLTQTAPQNLPPTLSAKLSVVRCTHMRTCLVEEYLDRFMEQEKRRLHFDRLQLLKDVIDSSKALERTESQIVDVLITKDVRLMNNLEMTMRVINLKHSFDDTMDTLGRLQAAEQHLRMARESFRWLAERAAVGYQTWSYVHLVQPRLYTFTYQQYLALFLESIEHSERVSAKQIVDRMTYSIFQVVSRAMNDRDRFLCALMLALEVEDMSGRVQLGEREYVVSPTYGNMFSANMRMSSQAEGQTDMVMLRYSGLKKPYDWLTEDQFASFTNLAISFGWFQETFDRILKGDGRETPWRLLIESDQPEAQQLPDSLDTQLTPLQVLIIIRTLRPERVLPACTQFILKVLGRKYVADPLDEFASTVKTLDAHKPIGLFYVDDYEFGNNLLEAASQQLNIPLKTVSFNTLLNRQQLSDGSVPLETFERALRHQIQASLRSQEWLVFYSVLPDESRERVIERSLHDLAVLTNDLVEKYNRTVNANLSQVTNIDASRSVATVQSTSVTSGVPAPPNMFRCFVLINYNDIPFVENAFWLNSHRFCIESPTNLKDMLVRAFGQVSQELLSTGTKTTQAARPDWPCVLHNICMLHCALRLRARYPVGGWCRPNELTHIGTADLQGALEVAQEELVEALATFEKQAPDPATMLGARTTVRQIGWGRLKFWMSEVIYGSYVGNQYDQTTLNAMIDYWISPNATRKDYEISRAKYKVPPPFFASNTQYKLGTLQQALDNVPAYVFDLPEMCNLQPTGETIVGDDQYIITRLNLLIDNQPAYLRSERPSTPLIGPAMSAISTTSDCPTVVQDGLVASASMNLLRLQKELELFEICTTLLQKLPRTIAREYLVERAKRVGGFTPFNLLVVTELERIFRLINLVKLHLNAIKSACELSQLGDMLTPNELSVACDLYNNRLPMCWLRLTDIYSAPAQNFSLANWFSDIQLRAQHLEKVLALGRERMPAYWLSAFENPAALIQIFRLEACANLTKQERASGQVEMIVTQTEMTSRDREHLRDPPADGVFVYGFYLWNAGWDKTGQELVDAVPKQSLLQLPVVHLTFCNERDKPSNQQHDPTRLAEMFQCPVFHSRVGLARTPHDYDAVMKIDMKHEGINAQRWALRGVYCTLKPY